MPSSSNQSQGNTDNENRNDEEDNINNNKENNNFVPGDIVWTTYGAGVIVRKEELTTDATSSSSSSSSPPPSRNDSSIAAAVRCYRVRLWRCAGKSIASSALAILQPSAILNHLPAAPGMVTSLINDSTAENLILDDSIDDSNDTTGNNNNNNNKVLVHAYHRDSNTFLVSRIESEQTQQQQEQDEDEKKNLSPRSSLLCKSSHSFAQDAALRLLELKKVAPEEFVQPAVAAKFYPVLETLVERADATFQSTAGAVQDFQQSAMDTANHPAAQKIFQAGSEMAQSAAGHADAWKEQHVTDEVVQDAVSKGTEQIESLAETVQSTVVPVADQSVKQVLTMMKDKDITVLLQECKDRLQKLVDTDVNEISANTRQALETSGIYFSSITDGMQTSEGGGNDDDKDATVESTTKQLVATAASSMEASRKAALSALDDLLRQADLDPTELQKAVSDNVDLQKLKVNLASQFTAAFDTLQDAASSDRSLQDLVQSLQEKTTEWQEMTGRLLKTRSANLFMEGANRLQVRAKAILQQNKLGMGEDDIGSSIGLALTKAFTEGDAALARLKTIELGDAVKNRLVLAIELRAESLGGLDGIIAGALATVKQKTTAVGSNATLDSFGIPVGDDAGDLKSLLSQFQQTATSMSTDAHETLLSALSSRSAYRDTALLRIETVLTDLESYFGDDLSAADLAAICEGQGGTAALFEPVAKHAKRQIESQLDLAEKQVREHAAGDDKAEFVLQVLQRVRKIMSGDLTPQALMEELVTLLNDDQVVAAGETLMEQSEQVLDAIEGVVSTATSGGGIQSTSDKVVSDAIEIAEKAGITKDSVMQEISKLNVNDLLDTAGSAVTDERARRELLSSATDAALDFILKILPSMPIPPLDGARDGLLYTIADLSMKGFKVKKEDIQIQLAGMRATKKRKSVGAKTEHFDSNGGAPQQSVVSEDLEEEVEEVTGGGSAVAATELLIIDVCRICAAFKRASWSFEQTYMPYLKGNGLADVMMADGSIRLQFELRKRKKENKCNNSKTDNNDAKSDVGDTIKWEPVLCLHDRQCTIGDVQLSLQGEGGLTWLVNKLATIFKGPLRDYVVKTIVHMLTNQSGWILQKLNSILSPYWDLIMRTAQLNMDDLLETNENVVVEAEEPTEESLQIELVWREHLPLGMNLLVNDNDGLKVVNFPRGSQARAVCVAKQLDPEAFKGACIVGVNGTEYQDQEELFEALRSPARPKTVRFQLADTEEAERIRKFVNSANEKDSSAKVVGKCSDSSFVLSETKKRDFSVRRVEFHEPDELGIQFGTTPDGNGLVVAGFVEGPAGTVRAAEKSGDIFPGDLLTHVNDEAAIGTASDNGRRAVDLLETAAKKRPLTLTFSEPYLYRVNIKAPAPGPGLDGAGGPSELILEERMLKSEEEGTIEQPLGKDHRRIVIAGFESVSGSAESSGILIGDLLVFINGVPVGAGCRWLDETPSASPLQEAKQYLSNPDLYPIGLTFARHSKTASNWTSTFTQAGPLENKLSDGEAETFCAAAEQPDTLGCVLGMANSTDIAVTDFIGVPGIFQRELLRQLRRQYAKENDAISDSIANLTIDWINGQFVPSYASKDLVKSALLRSWRAEQCVELWLCDDERKQFLHSL